MGIVCRTSSRHAICSALLLCALILIGHGPALLAMEQDEANDAKSEITVLIRDGNYNLAADLLLRVHEAFPDDKRALFDLVAVLAWAERYQESADFSTDYLTIRPPKYSLAAAALAHRRSGNYNMADALYRDGQARYPEDGDFIIGQMYTLADAGRYNEVDAVAEKYRKGFGQTPELAEALQYRDNKKANGEFLREWDDAALAAREGNYDKAIDELRLLKKERPDEKGLDNDLIAILSWAGRHREATELAGSTSLKDAPAYTLRAAALSFREAGDLAKAEATYRELLAENPDDIELAEGLALTLIRQNRVDDAEGLIARYKSSAEAERLAFPESLVVAIRRDQAVELGEKGDYDVALARLRGLREKYPGHIGVDHDILTILYWAGRYREAADLANGIDIDNAPPHVRRAAAFSLREAGELGKAADLYRELLAEDRADTDLAEALALTLLRDNRVDEAEDIINRYRNPANPAQMAKSEELLIAVRRDQAVELGRNGKYNEALALLRRLKTAHPRHTGIDYDIITVLAWAERYHEAASLATTINLDEAPDYVRRDAALSFKMTGDTARAEKLYRELIGAHPDEPSLKEAMAMVLLETGHLREAQAMAAGVRLSPESEGALIAAWRERIAALGRSGQYDDALAAIAEVQGYYPGHAGLTYDNVAILSWAERYSEVVALDIDVDTAPEYVVEAVAGALRKEGLLPEALSCYEKAMRRFPANPDLAAGRAMAVGDMGDTERANALLDEFAREHPEAEQKEILAARTYLNPPDPYVPPPRPETPYREEQDAIVARAREGEVDEAVKDLVALYRAHPDDVYLLGDYIVLMQWSRDNDAVIALSKKLNLTLVHDYVVETVMRAMMTRGDHYQAQEFLSQTIKAQQGNAELMASMAPALARAGDLDRALYYLDLAAKSRYPGIGNRVETAKKAMGFDLLQNTSDLEESNRRSKTSKNSLATRRIRAASLSGVRAVRLNKEEVDASDDTLLTPEVRRTDDLAAADILNSWGEETELPRDNAIRTGHHVQALDELARLQEDSSRADDITHWVGAGAGKIRAFYGMGLFCEAIAEYESIKDIGIPLPDGPLLDAAGAYLGARYPAKAKCLYLEVLARKDDPTPPRWQDLYEARTGLFWALLENEELCAALAEANSHYEEMAVPDAQAAGRSVVYPDLEWQKMDLHTNRGLAKLYTGFMAAAEEDLLKLVKQVPGNPGALGALASAQSMRGLPRTSNDTVRLAQIHAPSDIGLATQEAGNYLATQDWRKARDLLNATMPYYSQVSSVRQLKRDWDTYNLHELRIDVGWSRVTHGVNPNIGNDNVPSLEARLFSKPICYNWRAFIGGATSAGKFDEGYARQNVYMGGVEYRGPLLTATLEARADQVHDFEFGLELSGAFTPNDHWRFPFSFQRTSRDTPLRARHNGINAHSASTGASYTWNESRSVNTYFNFLDFTDGNRRFGGGGDFNQRLWTCYTRYIDGQINTYSSHNTKDDNRPYFNPKFDWELGAALSYGNILWRCYERLWSHVVTVGAGNYYQKYYGSGLIWNVNYSQTLTLSDRFTMTYGVGYGRRIYDGDPERTLNAFLSIVWRF